MQRLALLSTLALAAACSTTQESTTIRPGDAEISRIQFERMASLAGTWTGTATTGKEKNDVEMTYHLTAGGTAVEETLFPGTEHEMMSMYHLDGHRLMMTHYCSAGNQPSMVAGVRGKVPSSPTIEFTFDGATNLETPNAGHMHAMTMTFLDEDHMRACWTYWENGHKAHETTFEMTRTQTKPMETTPAEMSPMQTTTDETTEETVIEETTEDTTSTSTEG